MESKGKFIRINFNDIIKERLISELTLSFRNKKYQNGICSFIGSSKVFTGGIYFSAISAMRTGADQSHIFGHIDSLSTLKSYSPDLIVHGSYNNNSTIWDYENDLVFLERSQTISIGTCLGREKIGGEVMNQVADYIKTSESDTIYLIDADGLFFLSSNDYINIRNKYIDLLNQSIKTFILTPNYTEFKYLYKLCEVKSESEEYYYQLMEEFYFNNNSNGHITKINVENMKINEKHMYYREVMLSTYLNNQIIIHKGLVDIVTNGRVVLLISNKSSLKRCGGLGDVLIGVLSAFISLYKEEKNKNDTRFLEILSSACYFSRLCCERTFNKKGLSMIASDVIEEMTESSLDKI